MTLLPTLLDNNVWKNMTSKIIFILNLVVHASHLNLSYIVIFSIDICNTYRYIIPLSVTLHGYQVTGSYKYIDLVIFCLVFFLFNWFQPFK